MAEAPPWRAVAAIIGPTSHLTRRVEIFESNGTTPWDSGKQNDRLIDGSVTIDYSRDERRSFSLTLDNEDFALEHTPEKFWYDKVLKIYTGVNYTDVVDVVTQRVRTNLANNPNAGVNTTGYSYLAGTTGTATVARITNANSPASTTGYEVTWTAASTVTTGGAYFFMPVGSGTVTPGLPYSGRLYVRVSKSQRMNVIFYFYNDAGTNLSTAASAAQVVAANTWTEMKAENITAPAGATRILIGCYSISGTGSSNWAVGDKVAINGIMIEQGTTVINSFTGATTDFANRDYAWAGTAESSLSTETITVTTPTAISETWETQIGEFLIDSISEEHFPFNISVVGRDYTKRCMLSKFANATGFLATAKIEDVVKAIAQNAGITKFILPLTGFTLGVDTFFERGTSRWEAMKKVSEPFGFELFFDARGYLVMREYQDPLTAPLAYTMETGDGGTLVTYSKSVNDTRVFNHVVVAGESSDSDTIPVWAESFNTEPSSPTNIDSLGDRVYQYTSPFITTTEQAQTLANSYLKIMALEEYNLDFSSIALPWLEVGEIIQFNDPRQFAGQPTRFLLSSLTLPLGLGTMSANAKRVVVVG